MLDSIFAIICRNGETVVALMGEGPGSDLEALDIALDEQVDPQVEDYETCSYKCSDERDLVLTTMYACDPHDMWG